MQLPLPWRRGQPKPFGSIPRINWAHPLAQGLMFYGYDVGGLVVDLTGKCGNGTWVGTQDARSLSAFGQTNLYNNDGTYYFTPSAEIRASSTSLSWACAYVQTGTVTSYARPFSRTSQNGGSPPYVNFDFEINPGGGGQFAVNMNLCDSGGSLATTASWTGNANNVFTTLVGTATTGSTVFYAQGAQVATQATTPGVNNTQDSICFSGASNAGVANAFIGQVFYGAAWRRVLTPSEALQLHQDPYCFLIFPEDEIFSTLVGVQAIVKIPDKSYQTNFTIKRASYY